MKNFLFPIIAMAINLYSFSCLADTQEISEIDIRVRESQPRPFQQMTDPNEPDPNDSYAMGEYIRDRLKTAAITEDLGNQTMDIAASDEYVAQQKQAKKSFFEKIYDAAIERVSVPAAVGTGMADMGSEGRFEQVEVQQQNWDDAQENMSVINVRMPPYGEVMPVPAVEHIPYFFTEIDITPSGLINFKESIAIVANGEKLKYGLSRAIPKYSTSREGKREKIDLTLISVYLNGREVPYALKESDEAIFITPKNKEELKPGFYTYEIRYAVDRRLWYYEDFNEFYWDVTGSLWTLIVTRVGATLRLPNGLEPIGYTFLLGDVSNNLSSEYTQVVRGEGTGIGVAATRPLFEGEGLHIIASLSKEGFVEPTFSKKLSWFIDDDGNTLFSLIGLIAIALSYFLSWKTMNSKKSAFKLSLKKSAAMTRYLSKNVFDKISFVAFILELFKRNIIDIQKNEKDILLVKRTDNLKALGRKERQAVEQMFLNKESVLNINEYNALKIKRAYKLIQQDVVKEFKAFKLKLNFGYLGFSIGMLLITALFVAMINVDTLQTLSVIIVASCVYAAAFIGISKEKKRYKYPSIYLVFSTLIGLSVFIGFWASLFFMAMVFAIFHYTILFGKRNGLVKSYIADAHNTKDFLIKNKETISTGRSFAAQQPNIFALEISGEFSKNPTIKDFYKLDMAEEIVKKL